MADICETYSCEVQCNVSYRKPSNTDPIEDLLEPQFTLREFVSRMTCHGLQDIYASRTKLSGAFWAAVLTICIAILSYSVVECLREFYVNPIQTTIHVVPSQRIAFPDVTICPSNFINYTAFKQVTGSDYEMKERIEYFKNSRKQGEGILGTFERPSDVYIQSSIVKLDDLFKPFVPDLVTQQLEIINVSLSTTGFIRECSFRGRPCSSESIRQTLDVDKGICYIISVTGNNSEQVSPSKGLKLVIDIHTELDHDYNVNMVAPADGITVRTGGPAHQPVAYGGTLIRPGNYARLVLIAREEHFISVTQFSETPQRCNNEGDIEFSVINASYSREVCELDCIQKIIVTNLDCLLPMDVNYVKTDMLHSVKDFCRDIRLVEETFANNATLAQNLTNCRSNCFRECHLRTYDIALSSQKIPSAKTVKLLKSSELVFKSQSSKRRRREAVASVEPDGRLPKVPTDNDLSIVNISLEAPPPLLLKPVSVTPFPLPEETSAADEVNRWEDNIIVLDIAFDELKTTKISQSPSMTLNALLSNLGGTMGLWLGASLFTLLQFIVFLLKGCSQLCGKKRKLPKDIDRL